MKLKGVLFTNESFKITDWNNLEWFGTEEMYVPYCWVDEEAMAYGETVALNTLEIEVFESFEYLLCYKMGEFVASFEFPFITYSGQVITLKNFHTRIKI